MVFREKGESGDDAYRINATLVHAVLITLFGSVLSLGGYMTVWAISDAKWKASLDEKLVNVFIRLSASESQVNRGILPIAQERIEQLERRVRDLETRAREK